MRMYAAAHKTAAFVRQGAMQALRECSNIGAGHDGCWVMLDALR
jgi:hypothetical protein